MKLFGTVYAHCDVPCGVYETDTMRNAAFTCKVMITKIGELGDLNDIEHHNNFVRMVNTKEEHAETVKRQVSILWGDYFKPEHLEAHPDLHDKVWNTLKQASKVKQSVDADAAQKLIEMVHELEHIFADTKQK
jgi:nickel superoxide dismutase